MSEDTALRVGYWVGVAIIGIGIYIYATYYKK